MAKIDHKSFRNNETLEKRHNINRFQMQFCRNRRGCRDMNLSDRSNSQFNPNPHSSKAQRGLAEAVMNTTGAACRTNAESVFIYCGEEKRPLICCM